MTVEDRLKELFVSVLELDADTDVATVRYQETENWDSLGSVLLVAAMEDEFSIEIDTEQALEMSSYTAALDLLHALGITEATVQ